MSSRLKRTKTTSNTIKHHHSLHNKSSMSIPVAFSSERNDWILQESWKHMCALGSLLSFKSIYFSSFCQFLYSLSISHGDIEILTILPTSSIGFTHRCFTHFFSLWNINLRVIRLRPKQRIDLNTWPTPKGPLFFFFNIAWIICKIIFITHKEVMTHYLD